MLVIIMLVNVKTVSTIWYAFCQYMLCRGTIKPVFFQANLESTVVKSFVVQAPVFLVQTSRF
jgi:hypothetical protein